MKKHDKVKRDLEKIFDECFSSADDLRSCLHNETHTAAADLRRFRDKILEMME